MGDGRRAAGGGRADEQQILRFAQDDNL